MRLLPPHTAFTSSPSLPNPSAAYPQISRPVWPRTGERVRRFPVFWFRGANMDLGISGRVAMVAAASKGIGKAIAVGLAEEGCRISLCARSEESLESARHDLEGIIGPREVLTVAADVSKGDD